MTNIFKKKYFNIQFLVGFLVLFLGFLLIPSFVYGQVHYISNIDMQGHVIKGLGEPVDSGDAVTKSYADNNLSPWNTNSSDIYFNTGNVGIGISSPEAKLDVRGDIWAYQSGVYLLDKNNGTADGMGMKYVGASELGIFSDGTITFRESDSDATKVTFDVNAGTGSFTSTVSVGSPTSNGHAATKSYVDSSLGSYLPLSGSSAMTGNLDMGGNNITGINKLTASTIDPVFEIEGKQYATYMADNVGVEVQETGTINLGVSGNPTLEGVYKYIIDFDKQEKGSDLWLFSKTVDWGEDMEDLSIILTPGFNGKVWYDKKPENNQLIIFAHQNMEVELPYIEVSYRLVAPRIDRDKWGNEPDEKAKNPIRVADFIKKLIR